jgi:hypothetical protein
MFAELDDGVRFDPRQIEIRRYPGVRGFCSKTVQNTFPNRVLAMSGKESLPAWRLVEK